MKKTLVIVGIFVVFAAGYFYFSKPQPMVSKGVQNMHISRIADDALELKGDLVFRNPNKMRARLGKIDVDVYINNNLAGKIHDEFKTAVKGDEDFLFSFQIRFPKDFVMKDSITMHDVPVSVTGTAGSDVLFLDYTFPVDYSGSVKNEF